MNIKTNPSREQKMGRSSRRKLRQLQKDKFPKRKSNLQFNKVKNAKKPRSDVELNIMTMINIFNKYMAELCKHPWTRITTS